MRMACNVPWALIRCASSASRTGSLSFMSAPHGGWVDGRKVECRHGPSQHHSYTLAPDTPPVYRRLMSKKELPEPSTRKNVTLPNSLWQEIADYRFEERIGSEAEAVRR